MPSILTLTENANNCFYVGQSYCLCEIAPYEMKTRMVTVVNREIQNVQKIANVIIK